MHTIFLLSTKKYTKQKDIEQELLVMIICSGLENIWVIESKLNN